MNIYDTANFYNHSFPIKRHDTFIDRIPVWMQNIMRMNVNIIKTDILIYSSASLLVYLTNLIYKVQFRLES